MRRILSIENRRQQQVIERGDDVPEWVGTIAAMSDAEVAHVLRNLLIAGGPPEDAALEAVWEKMVDEGADALEAAEFDALHGWIMAN